MLESQYQVWGLRSRCVEPILGFITICPIKLTIQTVLLYLSCGYIIISFGTFNGVWYIYLYSSLVNVVSLALGQSHGSSIVHYNDVIMGAIASQITSLAIVYSTIYSGAYQRKHQSSVSLAFVRGIHRWPVNSPHKWPVTRKCVHLMTSSCCEIILQGVSEVDFKLKLKSLYCSMYK